MARTSERITDRSAVRRLHDRLGFGPRAGDLDVGFDATLDRLLAPAAPVVPPELGAPPQQPARDDREARKAANKARVAQEKVLLSWWLDRMVAEPTAAERLTWFWHGHFATSSQKVRSPQLMLAQNQTLRRHALGSFTDLARAMVVDGAMIRWLDGNDNRKGSPNENLAREFLELFTLGIGHYTETDVFEGARALTGWTVRRTSPQPRLVPARHDAGSKTIFGRAGRYDAKGFADLALAQTASAPYVAGRLWFRLVSPAPPSAAVRRRLQQAYGERRDVRALVRAVATDPAFTDTASTLVKQPVEWAVGLLRALGVRPSALDDMTRLRLAAGLRGMGQLPLRPPSVGGWPSGAGWLTTAAGVARLHVAQLVAKHADLGALEQGDRVDGVRALLGVDAWSDRTRQALSGLRDPRQLAAVAACAPEYVVSG